MGQIKVHFTGMGYLNGTGNIRIDKIVELDKQYESLLSSRERDEVKKSVMAVHYPGVEIRHIGTQIIQEKKEILPKESKKFIKGAVAGGAAVAVVSKKRKKKNESKQGVPQDVDFTQEIAPLLNIPLYGSKEDIQNNLDRVFVGLMSYKWASRPTNENLTGKFNSMMMNRVFLHYKIGIRNLKKIEPNKEEIKDYLKQLRKLRVKKIFNEFGLLIIVLIVILSMILLMVIASLVG
jgi:hypothetical protein